MENLVVINLKKNTMTFKNRDIRVISPLDPLEVQQYVELIKYEVIRGWDNFYNVSKSYINPTTDG